MDEKPKTKALELAIASVQKEFGDGAIMRLKDGEKIGGDVQVVPTGSVGLDLALGIGGYPRGRIVEIYGPESSGKTTLTLHAIANVQKQGGVAAFIDAEHALDVLYAKKLGVKTEELLISQPDYGEQALEIADMLVRSNAVNLVKNKMAPPFREVEFDSLYGQGISRAADVLDLASEAGVVERSGAWFSFQGERIGQGRDNARTYLEQHPQILDKVEALLLAKHGIQRATAAPPEPERPAATTTNNNNKSAAAVGAQAARPVPKGPAN